MLRQTTYPPDDLARYGYEVETCDARNPGPLDVVQTSGRYRATVAYEPVYIHELSEALGIGHISSNEAGMPHPQQGLEVPQLTPVSQVDGSNRSDQLHNSKSHSLDRVIGPLLA